jgi:hypothetical protein
VIDSQSVNTTEAGGPRGFDAGKKTNSALTKSASGERIWLKADCERCEPIRAQHDQQQDEGAVGGRDCRIASS